MAVNTNKIKRQLSKLEVEDLKDVFEFFKDEFEEEIKEEPKPEVKKEVKEEETPKPKEEVKKEEPKVEKKEEPKYDDIIQQIMSKIDERLGKYDEKLGEYDGKLQEITKEIPKTEDWGAKGTPSPSDTEYEFDNPMDIVAKLNNQDY